MSMENLPAAGSCRKKKKDGDDFWGRRGSDGLSALSADKLLGHCPKTELYPVPDRGMQSVWIHNQKMFL